MARFRTPRTSSNVHNGDERSFWFLRSLALVIALATWLVFSFLPRLEEISEPQVSTEIAATLGFETRDDYILLNTAGHTVTVRVRGRADRMRTLTSEQVVIQVPFPEDFEPNVATEIQLDPSNVSLPEDLVAEALNPDRLTLLIDKKERLLIQVRPTFVGEPAARAKVNYELTTVVPRGVAVEGPLHQLEELTEITTVPINLAGHAVPFSTQVGVEPPSDSIRILQPTLVTVHVVLEVEVPNDLTEQGSP